MCLNRNAQNTRDEGGKASCEKSPDRPSPVRTAGVNRPTCEITRRASVPVPWPSSLLCSEFSFSLLPDRLFSDLPS